MFDLFGSSSQFKSADAARLRRVEGKLDLILKHLGLTYQPEESVPAESRALADRGEKIATIRAYREQTGASLAEAKEAIESYISGRG